MDGLFKINVYINGMKRDIPEYSNYNSMKTRCYNKNRKYYYLYGGCGIKVSDDWMESFDNFYRDMGSKPSKKHSLDRINPDGNYCKENCRWATALEQAHNKRIPIQKECTNCGKDDSGKMRKGLCHACNEYKRRNSIDRPTDVKELKRIRALKMSESHSKKINMIDKDTLEIIKVFSKVTDAVNVYGMGVSNVLNGRVKTCKGYYWEYV